MLKRENRTADWPGYLLFLVVERQVLTHSSADCSGISAYLLQHKQNFKKTRPLFSSVPFPSLALLPPRYPCKIVTPWCWHFSYVWQENFPYLQKFSFFSLPPLAPIYFCNAFLKLLLPNDHVFQGKNMLLMLENKGGNIISLHTALHFIQVFGDHCALNTYLTPRSPQ